MRLKLDINITELSIKWLLTFNSGTNFCMSKLIFKIRSCQFPDVSQEISSSNVPASYDNIFCIDQGFLLSK